jgi:hypothetical protein
MDQLNFNEILERITDKLNDSDDETITAVYNQLFEIPVTPVGGDMWEEEIDEIEEIDESYDDDDDFKPKKKKSKFIEDDDDFDEDYD